MQLLKFVAYFYEYKDGKKCENTGYARVEVRQDKLQMYVHLRLQHCMNERLKIYLFIRKDGEMAGFLVGEGKLKWNALQQQVCVGKETLEEYQVTLKDIKGIYTCTDSGQINISDWEEPPQSCKKFYILKPRVVRKEIHTQQPEPLPVEEGKKEAGMEIGEETGEEAEKEAKKEETQGREEETKENETKKCTDDDSKKEETIEPSHENTITIEDEAQTIKAQTIKAQTIEAQTIESETKETETKETVIQAKEDTDMETAVTEAEIEKAGETEPDFVKIDLRALRQLPKREWHLASNRFLLHGYYNYHYLCMKRESEKAVILAVPGVYYIKEKAAASMFGFSWFECEEQKEPQEGQFGYWCRRIIL